MPQKHPTLWHIREQHGITRELLVQFKAKAASEGQPPATVLARLITAYVHTTTPPTTGEETR